MMVTPSSISSNKKYIYNVLYTQPDRDEPVKNIPPEGKSGARTCAVGYVQLSQATSSHEVCNKHYIKIISTLQ